jgi:SAM-dependent methyltransferase
VSSVPPCPICCGEGGETFFLLRDQPVLIGALWPDAESARSCRKGDIELAFCPDCGFVWNIVFDPARLDYDQQYDNSLHFSPTFQAYTAELVDRLVRTYDLRGKTVVDIGCGKGDFLIMLCEAGGNAGYGFDPSYDGTRPQSPTAERIVWSTEYFSEAHAHIPADLIASRFVYEHIPEPNAFLRMLRRAIAEPARTVVFFEVPNIDLIVRQGSVWDVIYEHCSYFGPESLARSFAECGFRVIRVDETYGRQFLTIEARADVEPGAAQGRQGRDLSKLRSDIAEFADDQARKREMWAARLGRWRREGRSVAAWGAGAKAVGFLNMMAGEGVVARVVDINPFKHGKHLSGTGQPIVAPEALAAEPPDTIILMNPIYRSEILGKLGSLHLTPELVDA